MTSIPTQGSLDDIELPRLLLELRRERFTGALQLSRDRTEKRILLHQGSPVMTESNLPSESLGVQLMDAGQISRDEYARVLAMVQKRQCKEGTALLALKLLEPKALFLALKEQVRRRVVECFGWSRGEFRLDPDSPPPEDVQPFRTDSPALVQEGLATHWSVERIAAPLTAHMNEYPAPTPAFAAVAKCLGPDDAVQRMVRALDGDHTLAQAMGAGASSPAVLAALWLLEAAGALRFRQRAASDEAEAARAGEAAEIEIEIAPDATAASKAPTPGKSAPAAAPGSGGDDPAALKMREEVLDRHARLDELNHYELLGLEADTAGSAIKKAYFAAAKRYHPDALGRLDLGDIKGQAGEVFSRITEAYQVLCDPDRRSNYDASLEGGGRELDANRLAQAETFYRKGEIMVRMGDFRGAMDFLKPAVDLWPEEAAYQSALGWAYYKKAPPEPDCAIEHLCKAVELDPQDATSHHRLGVVLRAHGDADRAAEHLARARKLNPSVS
jgi:tetratricopeptide (TPR) repeat protein